MQIQILSDLPFEFHADAGASFRRVASLDPRGVDVVVPPGDITVGNGIRPRV